MEQEIFGMLIREAGNLPTASARVSERLIVIEAAQGVELRFELVSATTNIHIIDFINSSSIGRRRRLPSPTNRFP